MERIFYSLNKVVLVCFAFALLVSCGSQRDILYFQQSDDFSNTQYDPVVSEHTTVIMPFDNLFITVSSGSNSDAVADFNINQVNQGTNLTPTAVDIQGYLVNQNGNINFPLIGEIKIAGLTKEEVTQLLQREISKYAEGQIIVNIRFLNYKVSVFGEVSRPGVYTVTDERISIPQAIALAGDLTIYGERRTVQLRRIENGKNKVYIIDLTSNDLFLSPNYYLRQNDILYVSPNKTRAGTSTYNQNLPLLVSLISVVITAVALFVR
jgi:polysaccharide export outer membrane protein